MAIPAGKTGAGSRLIIRANLSAILDQAIGKTAKIELYFRCSSGFLTAGTTPDLRLSYIDLNASGTALEILGGVRTEKVGEGFFRTTLPIELQGDESQIRLDLSPLNDNRMPNGRWVSVEGFNLVADPEVMMRTPKYFDGDSNFGAGRHLILGGVAEETKPLLIEDLLKSCELISKAQGEAQMPTDRRSIRIPAGESGEGSFLGIRLRLPRLPEGSQIAILTRLNWSEGFLGETIIRSNSFPRMAFGRIGSGTNNKTSLNATSDYVETTYNVGADVRSIEVRLMLGDDKNVRSTDGDLSFKSVSLKLISVPEGYSLSEVAEAFSQAISKSRRSRTPTQDKVVVSTKPLALQESMRVAGGGMSASDVVHYLCDQGVHAGLSDPRHHVRPDPWSVISGTGHVSETLLDFRSPPNADNQIERHGLFITESMRIEGLTILQKNGRYGIHLDPGGKAQGDEVSLTDIRVRHFGNTGSQAWRSPTALGMGACSGLHVEMSYLDLQAPMQALGWHDAIDQDDPITSYIDVIYATTDDPFGAAISLTCIGSSQVNSFKVDRIITDGYLEIGSNQNLSRNRAAYMSNFAGWRVRHNHGEPVGWVVHQPYETLVLRSRPVFGSSINIDGTNSLAFGVPQAGGNGSAAFVAGLFAIKTRENGRDQIDDESLRFGACAGDLSTAPETIHIEFEDGVWTLVLDQDFSKLSNIQMLDWLNKQLHNSEFGADRGFSIEPIWDGWGDVRQPAGESIGINRGNKVILKGHALMLDNNGVRLTDRSASRQGFAGIAMTRSIEGERVIYQNRGKICAQHLPVEALELIAGQRLSCGDNGSLFVSEEGSSAVLEVVRVNIKKPNATLLKFL